MGLLPDFISFFTWFLNTRQNYNRFTIARLKAGKVEIAQTSGGKLFHHLVQEGKK